MLILECSQGYYERKDGSVTISLCNFVGEGIERKSSIVIWDMDIMDRSIRYGGYCQYYRYEKYEDFKGTIIRRRKSKDRQHKGKINGIKG